MSMAATPTATQTRELHKLTQEVIGMEGHIEAAHHGVQGRCLIHFSGKVHGIPFEGVVTPTGRIIYGNYDNPHT